MTVINRLYGRFHLWHGTKPTHEAQAANPLTKSVRMGMPSNDAEVEKLNKLKGYRKRFQKVFCTNLTMDGITKAITAFERTILSGNSPADRYDMGGEENAISESAKRGLKIFQTKGRCTRCHSGFNFTDEEFHNLGIDWDTAIAKLGRYSVDKHPGLLADSRHQPCGTSPIRLRTCMTVASRPSKRSSNFTTKEASRIQPLQLDHSPGSDHGGEEGSRRVHASS